MISIMNYLNEGRVSDYLKKNRDDVIAGGIGGLTGGLTAGGLTFLRSKAANENKVVLNPKHIQKMLLGKDQ